ncbi:MAG: TatA/E family twin arginine-targeting protein translocase [Cyanophyceae cyanobacterium]
MNFLGVGLPEMILIFVVALLVFGPRKLPEISRTIAKSLKMLQDASKEFETTLNREARELEQATRKGTGSTSSRLNPRANQAAKTELAKTELVNTETEQAELTSGDPESSSEAETVADVESGSSESAEQLESPLSTPEEIPAPETVAISAQQEESEQEGAETPDQSDHAEDPSSQVDAA